MIKRIFFIQIISLLICSCSSVPLEEKYINEQSDSLTLEEKENIKLSKILAKTLYGNWTQEKKYQNEKIEATYHIHLKRDGTIDGIKLTYYFCGDDLNNECEHFILNMKNTILRTFPIKDLSSMDYKYWYCLWLPGGSKIANELFLKHQTNK